MSEGTKKTILVISLVVLLSVATYGIAYVAANTSKLKNMSATFGAVEFLGFKLKDQEAGLKVTLNLRNQSDFNVMAMGYKLDVYLNDTFVAPVLSKEQQTIKPNTISPFSFNVYFSPFKIFKDLTIDKVIEGLKDIKNVKIKVKGYITASVDGVKVENLPVDLEMLTGDLLKTIST